MKVLLLSPHTDDAELGSGGTIVKLLEQGHDISWAVFSTCEDAVPEGTAKDTLRKEFLSVIKDLNIKNYEIYDFPNKNFPQKRQEILDVLTSLNEKFEPELVICPSLNDKHQDHKTIADEAFRCFKKTSSIIGYELPWNKIDFSPSLFSKLTREHIDKKLEILKFYKSQITLNRSYFSRDFILGLGKMRGVQSNSDYAEGFEVIRWKI
jgi:LmbE family N-acetylglucosaminyl deacetylase